MVITKEEVENRIIRKRTPFNMEELIGLDIKGLTYKSITEDKGYPSMEQCLSFKKPLMMIMGAKGMAKSTMVALWVPFFWWNFGRIEMPLNFISSSIISRDWVNLRTNS